MRRFIKTSRKIDWKYILTELLLIVVGILLAINLNTWSSNRKLKNQTKLSINKISDEIKLNIDELQEVLEINAELNEFYSQLNEIKGDEFNKVNCSIEQMSDLQKQYGAQFTIKDSTKIGNERYEYELGLAFALEYCELNDIAWRTAQLSNNVNTYEYNCLKNILSVYGFQDLFVEIQKKFLDYKILSDEAEFIVTFQLCYKVGVDLLDRYKFLEEEIKECI